MLLQILKNVNQWLSTNWDKKRFELQDKRKTSLETILGLSRCFKTTIGIINTEKYVYLLERLMLRCHIHLLNSESYQFRQSMKRQKENEDKE